MSTAARLNRRITRLAVGRHLPYRAVRLRLTLLYGGLFLVSGAALMAIAYALLVNSGFVFTLQDGTQPIAHGTIGPRPATATAGGSPSGLPGPGLTTHPSAQTMAHWGTVAQCLRRRGVSGFPNPTTSVPSRPRFIDGQISEHDGAIFVIPATLNMQSTLFTRAAAACGFFDAYQIRLDAQNNRRRSQVRQQLLIQSGIALAGMSLLSLGLGWLMAGRVLQPLEDAYQAQRQFVANASHELRAPLTRVRAISEVALASPEASYASLRGAHERVLVSEQNLEQIIDGLLALTRGQAGLQRRERIDVATVANDALLARDPQLTALDVRATLHPAVTAGDPRLLERLISNLIDNAIRHNVPGGRLEIATGTRDRHPFLSIANPGETIPPNRSSGCSSPSSA